MSNPVKQDYEIFGDHSIYKDGWKAVANHVFPLLLGSIHANFYTEVSPDYEVSFEFTGDILKLTIHTFPTKLSQKDELERGKAAE